jgi:hypothetical protein
MTSADEKAAYVRIPFADGAALATETVDSISKALRIVRELVSHNVAYLVDNSHVGSPSGPFSVLVYSALYYDDVPGRTLNLPRGPHNAEELLYKMFQPFLHKDPYSRSIISAHIMTEEEKKELPGYGIKLESKFAVEQNETSLPLEIMQLEMLLQIPKSLHEEALIELTRQADSTKTEYVEAFVFD